MPHSLPSFQQWPQSSRCRSRRESGSLTPQRKEGLRGSWTLTAGGNSPCVVAKLVLGPGCAGTPRELHTC